MIRVYMEIESMRKAYGRSNKRPNSARLVMCPCSNLPTTFIKKKKKYIFVLGR